MATISTKPAIDYWPIQRIAVAFGIVGSILMLGATFTNSQPLLIFSVGCMLVAATLTVVSLKIFRATVASDDFEKD